MNCCWYTKKYFLLGINIISLICGILLIIYGIILVSHIQKYSNAGDTFRMNSISIAILIFGCVVFFISFLGCCGAIRENTCCILTYAVLMLVLFIGQLVLVVYAWTQNSIILIESEKIVDKVWDQRKTGQSLMNAFQGTFNCCGKSGSMDYTFTKEEIPVSCCGARATSCPLTTAITKPGCASAFNSFWRKNINIIGSVLLSVAVIELVAFIFACCLGCYTSRRDS